MEQSRVELIQENKYWDFFGRGSKIREKTAIYPLLPHLSDLTKDHKKTKKRVNAAREFELYRPFLNQKISVIGLCPKH